MNNINWKVRLQSKTFWVALVSLLGILAQQLGLKVPDNLEGVVNTLLAIGVLVGVITDPTTAGISDSEKALTYDKPKKG